MKLFFFFLDIACTCPHHSNESKDQGPSWSLEWSVNPKGYATPKQIFVGNEILLSRADTLPYMLSETEVTVHLVTQFCPALSSESRGQGKTTAELCVLILDIAKICCQVLWFWICIFFLLEYQLLLSPGALVKVRWGLMEQTVLFSEPQTHCIWNKCMYRLARLIAQTQSFRKKGETLTVIQDNQAVGCSVPLL